LSVGTGRFLGRDTFEGNLYSPLSLHRFLYTRDNPVMNVDPTGKFDFAVAVATVAVLGIVSPAVAQPTFLQSESAGKPVSMNKVTSGEFLHGLSMDEYYPDLAGLGYWSHGDTAGPFSTGMRAGSNVQLYGIIRTPSQPAKFSLAQTVTYTRF